MLHYQDMCLFSPPDQVSTFNYNAQKPNSLEQLIQSVNNAMSKYTDEDKQVIIVSKIDCYSEKDCANVEQQLKQAGWDVSLLILECFTWTNFTTTCWLIKSTKKNIVYYADLELAFDATISHYKSSIKIH